MEVSITFKKYQLNTLHSGDSGGGARVRGECGEGRLGALSRKKARQRKFINHIWRHTAGSTSWIVIPAGKWGVVERGGGMARTSEQSIKSSGLVPS